MSTYTIQGSSAREIGSSVATKTRAGIGSMAASIQGIAKAVWDTRILHNLARGVGSLGLVGGGMLGTTTGVQASTAPTSMDAYNSFRSQSQAATAQPFVSYQQTQEHAVSVAYLRKLRNSPPFRSLSSDSAGNGELPNSFDEETEISTPAETISVYSFDAGKTRVHMIDDINAPRLIVELRKEQQTLRAESHVMERLFEHPFEPVAVPV